MNFIKSYFRDVILTLTEPRRFFSERYPEMTLSQALALGVLTNWVSVFFGFLTRMVKKETLLDSMKKIQEQVSSLPIWKNLPDTIWNQAPHSDALPSTWIMETAGLALAPLNALFYCVFFGISLFFGAYLLISRSNAQGRDPVEISSLIKICAIGMVPSIIGGILGFLPLGIGGLIAFIYQICILTIGVSVRFKVSPLRGFGVIALPALSLFLCCSCFFAAFFIMIAKLFA